MSVVSMSTLDIIFSATPRDVKYFYYFHFEIGNWGTEILSNLFGIIQVEKPRLES